MIQKKEYLLISGMLLVFISFLFFGRMNNTYGIILLAGLLLSFISFISVLFSKRKVKIKILWIFIVLFTALIEQLIEPVLIKSSYSIFLNNNESELTKITDYLIDCPNELYISYKSFNPKCDLIDSVKKSKIFELMEKTDVLRIEKNNKRIFFELWGMLDTRLGIYYIQDKTENYHNLKGNWYY